MDSSVIISVFSIERSNDVLACINSLKKQTKLPKEIIVVLDPDEKLKRHYEKHLDSDVKIIISNACGLSYARNTGIKASTSELVAFIDDDAIADSYWLENTIKNFNDPLVIGVGGRIIPKWPAKDPNWFPEELFWIVGCSYKGLPTKKEAIRNPIGCNMVFRRQVFESAGFFSTSVGRVGNKLLGHDDTEFGIRATDSMIGTRIIYDPQSVVYHLVSPKRVTLKYVLKRSYAEGFSKAFVSRDYQKKDKTLLNTEKAYMRNLFLSTPSLILDSNAGIPKSVTLWLSTALVFLGYVIGLNSKLEVV
jgi:glucosyl-dolichyl phosphate glucuronosyltransferase